MPVEREQSNKQALEGDGALSTSGTIPMIPEQFELLGKVSQGGMGTIYKARNRYTNAELAIKVLRPDIVHDNNTLTRFCREAQAAQNLVHPNICRVYDFGGAQQGTPYLVMEWINGISLAKKVEREKRLDPIEAVFIFQQIAEALSHAHRNNVIHRDLKPENIMLSRDAEGRTVVHLVDFGIAKVLTEEEVIEAPNLTQTGCVIGTPMYMSPEQARGLSLDKRTDVYSLGCLMYFTVTGKAPFVGETAIDTITKHCIEPPPEIDPALKIPNDLKLIMFKAMEKNPDNRYQSMEHIATDLQKLKKGQAIHSKAAVISLKMSTLPRPKPSAIKSIVTFVIMGAISFLVVLYVNLGLQNFLEGSKPPQPPPPQKSGKGTEKGTKSVTSRQAHSQPQH